MGQKCCSGGKHNLPQMDEDEPATWEEPPMKPLPEVKMGSPLEQTEDDLYDDEKAAYHRPHKCTDVMCFLVFCLCLGCLGWVLQYAQKNGDLRRLYHGINWQGQLCGVDTEVAEKPYLYWCTKTGDQMDHQALLDAGIDLSDKVGGGDVKDLLAVYAASNHLDLRHPICVNTCPKDSSTSHSCFQDREEEKSEPLVTGTFTKKITYNFQLVQDYATHTVAKRYCVPENNLLLDQLEGVMSEGIEAFLFHFAQIKKCWQPILASAVLAVVLGYAFLILTKWLAAPIIYTAVVLAAVLPFLAGTYALYGAYTQEILTIFERHFQWDTERLEGLYVPSTGDKTIDVALGCFLCLIGVLMAILSCVLRRKIELVLGTIEATFDCMWDMPSMLIHPLLIVFPRILYLSFALFGLGFLVTVGEVNTYDLRGYVPGGLARKFDLSQSEQLYVMFYIFMAIWGLELLLALDQFVFGYVTQRWYFKEYDAYGHKDVSKFVFVRGYCVAITYHLGTLAFGAFLLALFRIVNIVLSVVYSRVKESVDEDTNNKTVVRCIGSCCCCCMVFWEKLARFLNKDAYLVVAVESVGFCEAAQTAFNIVMSEIAAVGGLEGATAIFQVGGLVSITSCGSYLTWNLCRHVPMWSEATSDHFIATPEVVTVVAGIMSFVVAACFTFVFDTVSDSMLFCWALDRKIRLENGWPPNDNLPPRLQALLDTRVDKGEPLLARGSKS